MKENLQMAWLKTILITHKISEFALRNRWRIGLPILLIISFVGIAAKKGKERLEAYEANMIALWGPHIAQNVEKQYNIPASIIISQAILEPDWGRSRGARLFNAFFGIKAHGRKGPHWGGKKHKNADGFARSYDRRIDSWLDHAWFLQDNPRYKPCWKCNQQSGKKRADCWAKALQKAGYCPKKRYPGQLIDLMKRYDLYRFNSY